MNDTQIHTQYSTGLSRHNIEQALVAAGKDLDHLQPADLALLEDFHTMGRIATSQLVDLIEMTTDDDVLDAGSGIGGTARFVAEECQCRVSAVDLTEEYCETARWLNRLVALDDRISVRRADVTELPFADATFQVIFSQHVQMNVADKSRLYQEARRVLADGGRLAMWDITSGDSPTPTTRCRGPTNPNSLIWPRPTSCAPSWSPRGSRSSTGTISPTRRPRRCRCSWHYRPTRLDCTPSFQTSPRKPRTSPGR